MSETAFEPPAHGLTPPGPPAESAWGPIYGARYGDAAYEARFGQAHLTTVSTPLRAIPGPQPPGPQPPGPQPPGPQPPRVQARLTFRPGVITLRPLSIADLLDGAVRTLRRRPALFFSVGALLIAVSSVLRAAIDALVGVTLVSATGTAGLRITPSIALTPVIAALLAGVLAVPTAQAVLGRDPTFQRLWSELRPRLPALLGYVAIAAVACIVPTLGVWYALGGRSAQQLDLFLALGALALVGEVVRLPFVAAPAAVVLEGAGPVAALRRSLALVRGSYARTLAVALLGRILVLLVSAALAMPLFIATLAVSTASGADLSESVLGPALGTVFTLLTMCLTMPFESTLRSLYYVDLRVRREGLDLLLVDAARRGGTA